MIFLKIIFKTIALLLLLLSFYSCNKKENVVLKGSTYNTKQVNQYYKLANDYYDTSKYDSAFYYANKTKLIINPEKEFRKYTISMFILTMAQQLQGDYAGAESSIVETLSIIEEVKSDKQKHKFYNILAFNYACQENYDEALYYYKKASTFNVDKRRKLLSILNIGHTYKQKKEYKKAIKILLPLLDEKIVQQNKYYSSGILNDIGYSYFKLGYPNAINYLNKSLQLNLNMDSTADNDYDLTANYHNLNQYYSKKDEKKATKYAYLLYQKATEYNNTNDRLLGLSLLIKHSTGKELKKYSLNYIHLSDSITKVKEKSKNYFAKLKYDSKKDKEENLKLKAEKELQQELEKSKNIVIIFTIVLIVFISGFIYYYLIEKNKKEKLQTAYNTEIRISKKLHDELANDIFQTINFAETNDLSSDNNTEKLLVNLDHIYSTTRNISRENSIIETGNLFEENLKEMIYSFKNHTVNIMINGLENMDWSTINNFKKVTIYRVIQELLINMKKHSKSNLVIVSFKKQENDLLLNYFDNGIGMNLEENIKKNGLQNAESRITAINGSFTLDSKPDHGVKINMIIPI
jgi:tetratricopeptide (TPR) repeat protein